MQKVTIRLVEPGDLRPARLAAHAHPRVVLARAVDLEPPLPRPPDAAGRARAGRKRRAHAPRPRERRSRSDARVAAAPRSSRSSSLPERARAPAQDPGVTPATRPPRRHGAAHRRGGGVRVGRRGREGVLRLRERDHAACTAGRISYHLLRRRVQPRADGPAHPQARRAGQGVRGLQHASAPRTTSRSAST